MWLGGGQREDNDVVYFGFLYVGFFTINFVTVFFVALGIPLWLLEPMMKCLYDTAETTASNLESCQQRRRFMSST